MLAIVSADVSAHLYRLWLYRLENLVPCAVESALQILQHLYSRLDNRAVAVMKDIHHTKHRVAYIFLSDNVTLAIAESAG